MEKRFLGLGILVMVFVFGMTVVGCDNDSTNVGDGNVTFISSTNNTVSNNDLTFGFVGTNVSSNNTSVATAVIDSGKIKITSVAQGSAIITVSDGTNNATIAITVSASGTITIGTITGAENPDLQGTWLRAITGGFERISINGKNWQSDHLNADLSLNYYLCKGIHIINDNTFKVTETSGLANAPSVNDIFQITIAPDKQSFTVLPPGDGTFIKQ